LYYLEKGLCLKHGTLEAAREELKRVIAAFHTPYPFNYTLFEAYVKPLNPSVADVATQRIVSALARFLAEHEVIAPFTWEFLKSLDPQALGYKKSTGNLILTGFRRAAGCLAAVSGSGVESLSSYKLRRAALAPLSDIPPFLINAAESYAKELCNSQGSYRNIGHCLDAIKQLGRWCELVGIRSIAEMQPQMITYFRRGLSYYWWCTGDSCEVRMPFDGISDGSDLECPSCGGSDFKQERRAGITHVQLVAYRVGAFLEWARECRLVLFNASDDGTIWQETEPVRRYLEPTDDQAVCDFMMSPGAHPSAAIAIYLFRQHGLKVTELRRLLIPPAARSDCENRKSLSECFAIIIPPPERGGGANGPTRTVKFLEDARPWLSPALDSYERKRDAALGLNYSLHFFAARNGDSGPVGVHYFDDLLEEASQEIFDDGGVVTPAMLRATFTDAMLRLSGPSSLAAGSTSRKRGYVYVPAPRIPIERRRKKAVSDGEKVHR
jgi:hypothetical protein